MIRIATILFLMLVLTGCKNSKHLQISKTLINKSDIYTGYVYSGNTTMTSILGPYRINFKQAVTDARRKEKLATGINELSEALNFDICNGIYCAKATATYYTKQKTNELSLIKPGPGPTRIKSEKIFGSIISSDNHLNYEINIRKKGNGYCRLPNNKVATIRPINKHTGFGKIVNGVGLEYVVNGKVIGAFTQKDAEYKIAIDKTVDDYEKLFLVALSVCLANKLNMISIL